jgi:PAS domain S-box-containing protein
MGRLIRSRPGIRQKRKMNVARPASDAKDAILARLELQETRSQLQIEHLQRLHADLKNANELVDATYQHCPVGYITLDTKGLIIEWNSAAGELLEARKHPLLQAPFTFFAVRDDLEKALNHLSRCKRADDGQVVSEFRLKRSSGEVLVQIISVPFRQGSQTYFQTALIDLTERKKNERALEESKQFSDAIIQTIHEPLLVVDMNLKILQMNEAFTKLFGVTPQIMRNLPLESVLNLWWTGNELKQRLEEVLLKNVPLINFEFEVHPRNKERRVFLFNARRVLQKENSPPALLIALEDITTRKEAEEKLGHYNQQLQQLNDGLEKRVEERTKELRASNKQLEGFCYSIAHDLRAPLRSMAGFSTVLLDDFGPQLGARGCSYLEKIVTAGQQMDVLIHDLLEYGRFTTVDFQKDSVDADEVLSQVLHNLEPQISELHARIERKGKLPKISGHKVVLEAAFSNLISNAMKFVRPHTRPKVTIWPEEKAKQIRIWIGDNGIGIEPRYHQRIFEVFQRLHPQEAYPGTGIGLAIVHRALQRIGGDVGVESEPGKGSKFWIGVQRAD